MNADVLKRGQTVLNVIWVVLALSFVLPDGGLVTAMRWAFVLMLGAHVLELAAFGPGLAKLRGTFGSHVVPILLYGFFHIQLVKLEAEGAPAD